MMFLTMLAGSLVTKTGSAMGCGNDWPLCNGKWVPEYTLESLIEYSHRLITGVAGLVVILFSIVAWRRFRGNAEVRALAMIGLFFIILESLLGASAVIWPQSSAVLALHFGFSLLAFSGVLLLTLFVLQRERRDQYVRQPVSRRFRNLVWGVAIYAYGVVYLGAYVRHTGSSMGCNEWPLCRGGELIPELTGQVAIHFIHRLAATCLFLLLLVVLVYAFRYYRQERRDVYVASLLAFILVALQVISGGFVVWFELHLYATMLHSAIITCLFGILCYLCLQSLKQPQAVQQERKAPEPEFARQVAPLTKI
ncbi:heme A synthase [Brevibacillus humidisoli]|uniref:COX15/CtaA family protein n=1 Tax=Brevibacillus humidisoli TaxID=2895522 RepID=UPI001E5A3718|nr:heme A synthase [Brevibacillus humidisoli]UFJ43362.1 heme A synthase [Brevibacillus humidisoli]